MREVRDPVSPWAFVLPIALAVCVGQFAADWATDLRRPAAPGVTTASGVQVAPDPLPAPRLSAVVAPVAADVAPEAILAPPPAPAAQIHPDAADPALPPEVMPAPTARTADGDDTGAGRSLPGPATARQAGTGESCIHNTVAIRSANGWEQLLENDAPVRCTASSP